VVPFVQGGCKKNCSGLRPVGGKWEAITDILGFCDRWTIPKSRLWSSAQYSTGSKANTFCSDIKKG
jgi:hypothetical protein